MSRNPKKTLTVPMNRPSFSLEVVSLDEDVLIEVYVDRKESECCVRIRVSPTMEADELTKTGLRLKNITPSVNDIWATFEVIQNGELERPLHYKEVVLEPVLQWSSLSEPGSAYLIVKQFQMAGAIKSHIDKNATDGIKAGYLKFKEEPSKLLSGNKFQERYFVLQEGKLFLYKDMKNSKPEKFMSVITSTFYLGVKRKMKPPTSWGFTAVSEKQQWLLCCDAQDTQMEWFISILMAQHNNDIWPTAIDEHTKCATKERNLEGISSIFIQQEQNPVKMRKKSDEKEVQIGKLKLGERQAKDAEEENSSLKQRASIVAHCLERKDEKVRSQAKKHRSMIGLGDTSVQGGKLQQTSTKTQKKKEDKSMQETMVINKLPSNVMQELNSVLQKSRSHTDSQ